LRYHSEKSSTKGQKSGVEDTVRPTEKQGKNYLCTDCKHFIKLLFWLLIFFEYRGIMLSSMNMLKMSSAELSASDGWAIIKEVHNMKKFQKMLSILLTAAMLLGLLSGFSVAFAATTSDSGSCGTSVSYMYNSGTLFIYGSGRMSDYNLGGTPWNSYAAENSKVEISSGVQNIGAAAFANLTSCRTYVIPSTVTEVGQYAFVFNSALTTISLPGVLTVGASAFVGCDALSSASYPATAIIASGNEALTKAAGVGGGSSSGNTPSIPSDSQLFASGVDRGIKWKVYTEGTMVIEPEYSSQMAYMPTYTTAMLPGSVTSVFSCCLRSSRTASNSASPDKLSSLCRRWSRATSWAVLSAATVPGSLPRNSFTASTGSRHVK
jgi:hypothetical protein